MSRFFLMLSGALAFHAAWAGTPEDAVASLNDGLAKVRVLNEADLLSDERGARFAATKSFVRERQCAARTANPLLLVSLSSKLNLTGSLDAAGGITIAGVTSADPGAAVKATSVGGFAIPLRISSLTGFPNEYLRESAALLDMRGMPSDLAQKMSSDVAATYDKLKTRVHELVNGYDAQACPKQLAPDSFWFFVPPTF